MKKRRRMALSLLLTLTLCMIAGFFPGGIVITARAAENVSYLDADGATQTAASATEVTSGSTAWENGWYVASGEVTIGSRVSVTGTVHLILADGANLTVSGGIEVKEYNSLTIYAQSDGDSMGALTATGGQFQAGIGGSAEMANFTPIINACGAITINGGNVTAVSEKYGAGIGGGYCGAGGAITINGGTVTANGGEDGAGIGGSVNGAGGVITINGGTVNARGNGGAGIGPGKDNSDATITLGWTDKDNDSIIASSYVGTVTFVSAFAIEGESEALTPETISNANGTKIVPFMLVSYLDTDGATQTAASATEVTSGSTAWENGWYVASGEVTIGSRVSVTGDVHLILADGANLTANAGISVLDGNSLTIYGQSGGTGALMIDSVAEGAAGIGGGEGQSGGEITINGGTVTATGGDFSAGIGGGSVGNGGTIIINGGTVTANGVEGGAGIGGGVSGVGGTITINGGTVEATGSTGDKGTGAGIGSGAEKNDATITLGWTDATDSITASSYGGTVTFADGKQFANQTTPGTALTEDEVAALTDATIVRYIPSVSYQDATVNDDSTVTFETKETDEYTSVTSGSTAWSAGWYVVDSDVTISSRVTVTGDVHLILCDSANLTASGGINVIEGNSLTIYAQSTGDGMGQLSATATTTSDDRSAAGIGGYYCAGGEITINGGAVTATGGYYGAGIGGGHYGSGGAITINGGSVTATGGGSGAGIGGGNQGANGGIITINGGTVTANGGSYGAGIGGGAVEGAGGTITINGGSVTANGGNYGAGIGGGHEGAGGAITINGGAVTATGGNGDYGYNDSYGGAGIGGGDKGADGTITLGWTEDNDSITASSYGGTVTIVEGKQFVNSTATGTPLTTDEIAALTGATIVPYIPLPVSYQDAAWNATTKTVDFTEKTAEDYTPVMSNSTVWSAGWYVVNGDVTIGSCVSVTGAVHLILADGANLTASEGITVSGDDSLTIYAQSTDETTMGALTATSRDYHAGIGGNNGAGSTGGTIIINGGKVKAKGGGHGAGIGGGYKGAGGTIAINGGAVTATGGD